MVVLILKILRAKSKVKKFKKTRDQTRTATYAYLCVYCSGFWPHKFIQSIQLKEESSIK